MKRILTGLGLAFASTSTALFAQPTGTMYGAPQPAQKPADQTQDQVAPANASGPQPSAKARKAIVDLQTAVNANDTANFPAKLAAAQAVANTKEDRYWVAVNQLKFASKTNDLASESAAVDALATSGLMPTNQIAGFYSELGAGYYNAKQYDQAVAAFEKQKKLDPGNTDILVNIAEIRNAQGRNADAVASLQQAIQAASAGGKKADESLYKHAVSMAYQGKLANAGELSRQWVSAYPSSSSWHDTIAIYRNAHLGDSPYLIDIFRLATATNSMQEVADYELYSAKAADAGNWGEAKSVADAAIASGKVPASNKTISSVLVAAKGKVPTETDLAAAEKTAAIPTAFVRVGDRYYAAGNYAKAAALYRQGLAKGSDANLTNLRLGEALARSGDKAGAVSALSAVGGELAELAKLWLVYAQRSA